MYSEIKTGAVWGVSAYMVSVEVDIASGLPAFNMVGSLGKEVRESKYLRNKTDRTRSLERGHKGQNHIIN